MRPQKKCCSALFAACISLLLALPHAAVSALAASGGTATMTDMERSFQKFLAEYREQIHRRDTEYLETVHPKLPAEMYDFFINVTLQMMRHSEENSLEPEVECREYGTCKAIYTQPDGSWAAQSFILYEGAWRWLDQ
jgi:hypothetical protein